MPVVTLDPAALGPGITLSSGNLTATSSGATGNTLATAHFPTGKYYYEFTVGTAANTQIGVMNAAGARSEYLGFDYSHSAGANWNGGWLSSGGVTTAPALVSGHVYGMAIDITNKKAWLKDLTAASSWNSNGSADPVTGVNAATFATITGDIYPACSLNQSGDQITFNFGATAYTGTVPSGYASWSGAPPTGTLAATEAQDVVAFAPPATLIWSDEFRRWILHRPPTRVARGGRMPSGKTSTWVTGTLPAPVGTSIRTKPQPHLTPRSRKAAAS